MTLKCARRLVLALATLCPALGVLGYAQPSAPRQQQQFAVYGNGPVAVAMRNETEAVILQLKGRVSTFNVRRWAPGETLYSVPGDFDATDMSAASAPCVSRPFDGLAPGANASPFLRPSGVFPVALPYTTFDVIVSTDCVCTALR